MVWLAVVSTIIAAAALGLSLYTLFVRLRADGHAHFTAEWETRSAIIVTNEGPGLAKDLTATWERETRRPLDDRLTVQASTMGARQTVRLHAVFTMGEIAGPAVITWNDNRRRQQRAEIELGHPPEPVRHAPTVSGNDMEKRVKELIREEVDRVAAQAVRRVRRR